LSELRPRTVWDVVDDAFDLFRENFALLTGVSALAMVPFQIVQIAGTSVWFQGILRSQESPDRLFGALGLMMGVFALTLPIASFVTVWQSAAVAVAVEERIAGRPSGIGSVWRKALRHGGVLLGAALLFGLMSLGAILATMATCGLGVALFPLIYVLYAFVPAVVVLERKGAARAFQRARDLVLGQGWRIFGLVCVLFAITFVLTLCVQAVMEGVTALVPWFKQGNAVTQQTRETMVTQMVEALATTLIAPLTPIALTLAYFDARVRREGLDVVAQARQADFPIADDPFGDATSAAIVALQRRQQEQMADQMRRHQQQQAFAAAAQAARQQQGAAPASPPAPPAPPQRQP
jgi:hypothetical protein